MVYRSRGLYRVYRPRDLYESDSSPCGVMYILPSCWLIKVLIIYRVRSYVRHSNFDEGRTHNIHSIKFDYFSLNIGETAKRRHFLNVTKARNLYYLFIRMADMHRSIVEKHNSHILSMLSNTLFHQGNMPIQILDFIYNGTKFTLFPLVVSKSTYLCCYLCQ